MKFKLMKNSLHLLIAACFIMISPLAYAQYQDDHVFLNPVSIGDYVPNFKLVIESKYKITDDERLLMEKVVAHEVGNCSEESQILVANIILNRFNSELFPNTITEVIYQNGQFSGIHNLNIEPNDSVKAAVQKALEGEDNSDGALYYYSVKYTKNKHTIRWFESLRFCLELEGQRYFK